ncbi:protein arginine N-methyltransferase 9-like [Aricia agestis]|uniref:protein arginine N-methyltransferase 9-like n=1 Tax=Aricia agestis TaxID=91739 RepID=UPI001C208C00|nr:protein arginine N-methyltransferase 9-like [Aricia agestis]
MASGREYITYARNLCNNGCYSKAYDLYLAAFNKSPHLKIAFEPEFRATLFKVNELLAVSNNVEDIFGNFSRAITAFPGSIHLLNEIGKYIFKYRFYEEAWTQFQKALEIDPGFVDAEKNLNSLKNLMVERWHFRMLNDKRRNDCYRVAIHDTIVPLKESILDLGTGTGLLSMYATEKNPMAITACDSSKVMTALTDTILEENKLLLAVVVVNKLSTTMNYKDIGGKRSLLITEVFDAGLFGEHILQSLSHAWENLLSKNAKVIPAKAEFFVMGVNSDLLNAKYHLHSAAKSLLNIGDCNVHILNDEPYDCEDVDFYKDIKYVTESKSVVSVDFNNLNDIRDKLQHAEPINVELRALENGRVDLIVGWFNLYLSDYVTITTDPRSQYRARAWQQAIFFDCIPRSIKENQNVDLHFLLNEGKVTMLTDATYDITIISPETLKFLNDTEYTKAIVNCIGVVCVYLGQMAEMSEMNILDLSPFPIFGFLMLKRGVRNLKCYAKTEEDKEFLDMVFKANHLDTTNVTYLIGDNWSRHGFHNDKYHVIFSNMLDISGDIDIRMKDIGLALRNSHLAPGGLFMPSSVTLMGQIIYCHWLDVNNRVCDANIGDYRVGRHINKYQVSQNFCLDYAHLEYTAFTDSVPLGDCFNLSTDVINLPIIDDGYANAILCWYSIELMESVGQISTKRSGSFIDGMAFLASPVIQMVHGDIANILQCVDSDGSFKLVIDVEDN